MIVYNTVVLVCSRYRLTHSKQYLADRFQAFEEIDDHPRYNIAPTQPVLTVRREHGQKVRRFTTRGLSLLGPGTRALGIERLTLARRL